MKTLFGLHLIFLWAKNEMYFYAAASPILTPNGLVYITNGGSLALTCEIDQDAAVVTWLRNNLSIIQITNTTVCSFRNLILLDTYNYSMTCDQQRRFSMVKYGVNSSDDNTSWRCQVFSLNYANLGSSLVVKVLMHVPVGSVELLNGSILTLIENQSAVLVCETDACRPSATIFWIKDGINITDFPTSVTAVNVGSDLFVSRGTLTYTGQRGDNRKILTCGAYNGLDSAQISGNLIVTIYYPPKDPPVIEGQANGSIFTVIENTSQTLTCRIFGGNPLANLSWICLDHIGVLSTSGETVSSEIVLSVDRSAKGKICTCRSSHQLDGNKDVFVTLHVHYSPSIEGLTSPYKVIEYQPLNVTCQVSSNPIPDQIFWSPTGDSFVPSTLYFSSVSRNKSGTYSCTAHNMMVSTSGTRKNGTNTSQIQVDVLYPPSTQGHTISYKVIENHPLSVNCEVNSNPPPDQISWSPSGEGSVPSTLYFSSVSRNKSGTYVCKAQNTMTPTVGTRQNGINTSQIKVDVLYGARIVNLSVHDGNIVNENSSSIFKCHVDSNPPSTITWMKESSSTVLKTDSGVVQSQYIIESAECLNMDNYTCSAYNGIWTKAKESLEIFVRCHPRTDFRLTLETKIYRKRHEAAVLSYTVISYPLPTFKWTFLGNGSGNIGLPVSASQYDDGQQSQLRFTSLGIDDFGNYSVIADNSLAPSAREVFEIIPADVPDVPSCVIITEITQTSVKVQWVAGNNGGLQQTFHVVASAVSLTHSVNIADPGYLQNGTAVLGPLLPGTKYSIYVVAINSIGSSNMTKGIIVTTLEVAAQEFSPGISVAWVAGGVSVGIVVILIVSMLLFLWRRYRHPKKNDQGIAFELEINADVRSQDNDLYDKLHPYANSDIQLYSSLKMQKSLEDHQQCYENTWIKA